MLIVILLRMTLGELELAIITVQTQVLGLILLHPGQPE
jgi:hypothetical protein